MRSAHDPGLALQIAHGIRIQQAGQHGVALLIQLIGDMRPIQALDVRFG